MLIRIYPTVGRMQVFRQAEPVDLLPMLRGWVAYFGIYNLNAIEVDDTYLGRMALATILDLDIV